MRKQGTFNEIQAAQSGQFRRRNVQLMREVLQHLARDILHCIQRRGGHENEPELQGAPQAELLG
jgi:hypothetical protein